MIYTCNGVLLAVKLELNLSTWIRFKNNVEQKKQVVKKKKNQVVEWYVQYNTIYIKFKSMQMVCTYKV